MKKPNFFILGAPKCGTTSLADWLSRHEKIFMSTPKEPHFFNTESIHRGFTDLKAYEQIFDAANDSHQAVGEASVWYLASSNAVGNILKYQPDAKFIVCLRNPVEMVVSLHDQKKFSGEENLDSFWDAWEAQESRKLGKNLPSPCAEPDHLQYGVMCSLGNLVARLLEQVDKDHVHYIFMDDIKKDSRQVYLETLDFLNIDDDGKVDFPVVHVAKIRKLLWLRRLTRAWFLFKQKTGINMSSGIANYINKWNRVERQRGSHSQEQTDKLREYFDSDIKLLSDLTGKDLSRW